MRGMHRFRAGAGARVMMRSISQRIAGAEKRPGRAAPHGAGRPRTQAGRRRDRDGIPDMGVQA